MNKPQKHFYEFERFRIDAGERVLLRDGAPIALPPKVFDTLLALVEHHGHIIEKDDLIKQLWPETFVEENNLSQYISAIRKTLGDGRHEQRFIETVPRRGYRFTGVVREAWGEEDQLIGMSHTKMSLKIHEETETESAVATQRSTWQRIRPRTKAVAATAAVVVLIGAFVAASRVRRANTALAAKANIKTLAVLPLKSGSGDDKFLGLSIADDLISRFDRSLSADVRPTSSTYRYFTAERDAVLAGRELKVDAVFDGEVQRSGERLAVSIRLLDTAEGKVLWQARYEDDLKNSFALRDSIVDKAAREVFAVPASSLKTVLAKRSTTNAAAHEAYVRGRYLWNKRTAEGLHQSITLFEKAIAHDPNYALAFAALADAYAFDHIGWPKAEATARKALALDQTLGQAHATVGFVRWFWLWDWSGADREYKLAIALNPNYATAHQWYGIYLASRYYLAEAKAEMQRALELDPFSLSINADLAQVLYFMGDFDGAIQQCQKTLALDQNFVNAHIYLYQAYTLKGQHDDAVAEYFKVQQISNGNPSFYPQHEKALRAAYAASGIRGFWHEKLNIETPFPKAIQDQYRRAEFYALFGDEEKAVDALSKAIEKRDPSTVFTRVNPMFRSLYDNPRFNVLINQIDNWPASSRAMQISGRSSSIANSK